MDDEMSSEPVDDLTVGDIMSTAVISFRVAGSVGDAEQEMRLADIRHLPIVDENDHLVGIVSDRDIRGVMSRRSWRQLRVSSIMTTGVLTATAYLPAAEAAHLLLRHKIGALPVVGEGGDVIGVITETDFLRIAYRALQRTRTAAAELTS